MISYNSPRAIDELMQSHGLVPSKRFGQNFLINEKARNAIIAETMSKDPVTVWEIGPGIGTLTHELAASGCLLTLFEIDNGFVRLLREGFSAHENVRIIQGDVVETLGDALANYGAPDVIVGNLPYNSAAKIVLEIFRAGIQSRLVFTMQREMAVRIGAETGHPEYSSFSIICRTGWTIRTLGVLKPGSFHPRPHVDSQMIVMEYRDSGLACSRDFFLSFCRCLFASRRKTIKNNISRCPELSGLAESDRFAMIESLGVDLGARSEELSVDLVGRIADTFSRAILS